MEATVRHPPVAHPRAGQGGLGVSGSPGTGGVGGTGAGGGVYNAPLAVLTSSSQVAFQRNVSGGGSGGSGGAGFIGIGGAGGNGKVALGGGSGVGTTGGHGGLGGAAKGAGLFNAVGATARFTAPATNSTSQSVALFASNSAIAGQGGDGGIGGDGQGGFGGNGFYGALTRLPWAALAAGPTEALAVTELTEAWLPVAGSITLATCHSRPSP